MPIKSFFIVAVLLIFVPQQQAGILAHSRIQICMSSAINTFSAGNNTLPRFSLVNFQLASITIFRMPEH